MKMKKTALALTALALSLSLLAACGNGSDGSSSTSEPSSGSESTAPESGEEASGVAVIGEDGYWEGITATDYVIPFDYDGIAVPVEKHEIADDAVQAEVDNLLAAHPSEEQVTDRAVEDGDTLNIDFVGSVDGVEFEGGSTDGAGTSVTIGVTNYIDDFMEQLVGHMPGETFNVEVTFPEDYGNEELNGKDAIFVTTINYILITNEAELTDAFVEENLSAERGWKTVDEMREGVREELQKSAVSTYLQDYLTHEVTVSAVPDSLMAYMENMMVTYYEEYAAYSGMELEGFLSDYEGVTTVEELLANYHDDNMNMATYYLVVQSVAEKLKLEASEADVVDYFTNVVGETDISMYEEQFGMPYLKQAVIHHEVTEYLYEHAILE